MKSRINLSGRYNFLPILLAVVVFLLAFLSPVSNTSSDPRMGLMVSQNIVENNSFRLDAYRQTIEGELMGFVDGVLVNANDHIFYYFPLGTPIIFTPLVWLTNQLGWDMSDRADEQRAQNLFSALVAAALCLVIYAICRHYLEPIQSLIITAVTVLGSSLISTVATALWSMDLAALFVALTLWLLARFDSGRSQTVPPLLLGTFLFAAYLCRPSTAIFIAVVFVYLFVIDRSAGFKTAAISAGLLILFLVFSRIEYGQWLPPYYNESGRFQIERPSLWVAIYGNLLSPSRGLLIFSPFLIPVAIGAAAYVPRFKKRPLFWMILAWFVLLLLLLARSTKWWGGYAYGPRLLVEVMPGLMLLTVFVWQEIKRSEKVNLRNSFVAAFLLLGLVGIWINAYQGLFNRYTSWWNGIIAPDVDRRTSYLFNWDYPQFLASNDSLCRRNREFATVVLAGGLPDFSMAPYYLGEELDYLSGEGIDIYDLEQMKRTTAELWPTVRSRSEQNTGQIKLPVVFLGGPGRAPADALFIGWSPAEDSFRWSFCQYAQIAFVLPQEIDSEGDYLLEVTSGALNTMSTNVWMNGRQVGEMVFSGVIKPPVVQSVEIPGNLLQPANVNLVSFEIPAAHSPGWEDPRVLGLSFVSLRLSRQ